MFDMDHDVLFTSQLIDGPRYPANWHLRGPTQFNVREILNLLPATASVATLFVYLLRVLRPLRPRWMSRFIQEPLPNVQDIEPRKRVHRPFITLLLLCLAGLLVQTLGAVFPRLTIFDLYPVIAWAISFLVLVYSRPKTTSFAILTILSSLCLAKIIALIYVPKLDRIQNLPDMIGFTIALCGFFVVLWMPLRNPELPNEGIAPVLEKPSSSLRSPEDNLTLWEYMSVSWMAPLIAVGKKRQLNDEDVWDLPYEFKHRRLHDTFRDLRGSVIRRLLSANGLDLLIISVLGVLELSASLIAPLILQQLLRAMSKEGSPDYRRATTWAMVALFVRLISAQSGVFTLWFSRRTYERSRGEMITMLFAHTLKRKILHTRENPISNANGADEGVTSNGTIKKPSPVTSKSAWQRSIGWVFALFKKKDKAASKEDPSQSPASMGKILNLMRNDVYEVAQRFWEFPSLITQPLGLILSVVLIWRLIGPSCLVGIAIVVVAQGANVLIARFLIRYEKIRRAATDSKLQKISQFVESIRHLRWYAWQDFWLVDILNARQRELNLRIVTSVLNLCIAFLTDISACLFPVGAFWAYTTLAHAPLPIDVIFPSLDLFSILIDQLRQLPGLITILLNAAVAVRRLEAYMKEPEKLEMEIGDESDGTLELKNASFSWPSTSEPVLHDISITFPPGLTVVYGEVASGKTALLQALLGELDQNQGQLIRPGKVVGYCAQSPWLQSMSIRDNILFTYPYDEARYKEVLNACALMSDLGSFKHGDLSKIGENGIGLSGGQRARVALARAIYSPADIVFLDDPLSALDHQTAESIVEKCISGPLLKEKTVVLVTHRTQLCRGVANQWVEMHSGKARLIDPQSTRFESHLRTAPIIEDNEARQQEEANAVPDFIEEEHREHGEVQVSVYLEYIKAGRLKWWGLLVLAMVIYRLCDTLQTWFIKEWGEGYKLSSAGKGLFDNLPPPEVNVIPWLKVFLVVSIAVSIAATMVRSVMYVIIYKAGKRMFTQVMKRVSYATFHFYDVTPVGRLMNRLTSDMSTVDGNISITLLQLAMVVVAWLTSLVIIASATPVFLIFAFILSGAFVLIFLRFLPTSQSLRRLEMVSLTPLLSNFGALLDGLTTVRAFCAQHQFIERVIGVTDSFQKMDHFYWSLQSWLSYRFDTLSALSTFILSLLALYTGVSPGLTAFVLIAANRFVNSTHRLCKCYGQLQMDFVSVERIVEISKLEQEPPGSIDPPAWWPSFSGDIVWDNVTIKYAPHLEPALQNVSVRIPAGSNTAIVGRTGSGKSTFALALLATILPESGSILIDNLNITDVNHQTLRSRVTFLAQDPVLFPGTMRQNLDPLSEYSDDACADVLRKSAARHGWTIDTTIDAGGKNLSQGQRQLVGLARAMLRRSAIVILDEATASIDLDTANEIQRVLREEMQQSTVITIAHRLEAVQNANFCIVLEKGRVVEAGDAKEIIRTEMFAQ